MRKFPQITLKVALALLILLVVGRANIFYQAYQSFKNLDPVRVEAIHPYSKYSYKYFKRFFKETEKKYGLRCEGSGMYLEDKLGNISLSFACNRRYNKDQARALLFECTNYLLETINHEPGLKDYLTPYPLTYKDIHIMIGFQEPLIFVPREFVALIFNKEDRIFYCSNDPVTNQFCDRSNELFEEGLKIFNSLKEENKKIL
jgi:hypothetical protein